MFYSPELYFRRKGKLARCWLAATLSEKMFKKTVKHTALQTIDISVLCDEILSTIYGRFSLYLSSQLMYGATKILYYQTMQLQDTLFTIYWETCNVRNSRKMKYNLTLALNELEGPRFEISYEYNAARRLNLITNGPSVLENKIRDEPNFGVLTDYEMETFLLPQAEDQFLNEIRKFAWDEPQEIREEFIQVPPEGLNNFEVETVEIRKEIQSDAAGQKEFLIDVEDVRFKKPVTPRKRSAKSLPETSAKKRKISSEEVRVGQSSAVDIPLLAYASSALDIPLVPESVMEPTEVSNQGPILVTEFTNQRAFVEDMESVQELRRRRKPFVDNKTVLSDDEMRRQTKNVTAHTTERRLYNKHFHPTKYYFEQPSSKIFNGVLGEKLAKLFSKHMITRSVTNNEFPQLDIDLSLPNPHPDETVRAEAISKIHERTVEISSKIAVTAADLSEHSKTAEKLLSIEDLQPKLPEDQIEVSKKQIDESLAALPDITDFEEKLRGTTELSEKSLKMCNGSPTTRRFSPKAALSKPELGALLEICWNSGTQLKGKPHKGLAAFHEVISPDSYTKIDSACAFYNCLVFHAEKLVVLKQAMPFDTIWIEKYARYSSESSSDTF